MKNNRQIIIAISTLLFVILLAGCQSSTEELKAVSHNDQPAQEATDDSSNPDDTSNNDNPEPESAKEKETTDQDDSKSSATKEDAPADQTEVRLKEEYLEKLQSTKQKTEQLEATDSSTYALKKVENERWEAWDKRLNEIYGTLEEQLSQEEMNALREKQRDWIQYRDDQALEASLEYEGGTQEHLEYVSVLANLTEERCYELVKEYMV
ncbi:DUF1311 domain-containing protein [Halobacillus fulvus]|nr:DUF1311 domain-containing protein [Halobacillus fulvus]